MSKFGRLRQIAGARPGHRGGPAITLQNNRQPIVPRYPAYAIVELPDIAAVAAGPGAWFDTVDGLSDLTWVDRMNGLALDAYGDAVVVEDTLHGRPVVEAPTGTDGFTAAADVFDGPVSALSYATLIQQMDVDAATTGPSLSGALDTYVRLLFDASGDGGVGSDLGSNAGVGGNDNTVALLGGAWVFVEVYVDALDAAPRTYLNGVLAPDIYFDDTPFDPFTFTDVTLSGGRLALFTALPVVLSVAERQTLYAWVTGVYGVALPAAA